MYEDLWKRADSRKFKHAQLDAFLETEMAIMIACGKGESCLTDQEIADIMGCSISQVKSITASAFKKIRESESAGELKALLNAIMEDDESDREI